MKEERLWCAWCGKWGDHQSGYCPIHREYIMQQVTIWVVQQKIGYNLFKPWVNLSYHNSKNKAKASRELFQATEKGNRRFRIRKYVQRRKNSERNSQDSHGRGWG